MTRSELVTAITQRFPQLVQLDADLAVKEFLGAISASLVQCGRTEIRGFGTLEVIFRPPRLGRNPKTGEQVAVDGKYVPHFKAGKELRERVQNAGETN